MKIHIGHHFYGAGNLGDDLMMSGFIRAWCERGLPGDLSCATPFERSVQKARFPQINWLPYDLETRTQAIRDCTIWLGLGGPAFEIDSGSWLVEHMAVELELCKRFHKPMFYLCVGVSNWRALEDPRNIAVLNYVERIWTRDDSAAKRLASVCSSDKVVSGSDLSHLYLAEQAWPSTRVGSLAWLMHFDDAAAVRPQSVALAIDALPQWDHHWLVQEVRELAGSELATLHALPPSIRNKLHIGLPDYSASSSERLLAAWPNCEAVITSRFHGALIAGWRGARVAIVERNDKLSGLAHTLGCPSISADYDKDSLCQAIASSAPLGRDVLEGQCEIARSCCNEFFDQLQARYFVGVPELERAQRKQGTFTGMTHELSKTHTDVRRHFLSADEIDQFHEQGFLGPFTAMSAHEISTYTTTICEKVMNSPSPHSGYPTENRHLDSHTVWKLSTHPAIVDRLVSLYGPDLIVWDSNIFDKGPASLGQPEEYPWHQDMWHWKLEPQISLSVWIALTPATPENGCVEFIPGTHVCEIPIKQNNDPTLGSRFAGHSADPTFFNEADKVAMPLEAGQFFIFNEAVLHHSHPNRTQDRRIGLALRITVPRVKSDRTYPCLVLSGTARGGANRLAEPPQTDPDPSGRLQLPQSDSREISLAGPINGMGWHLAEHSAGTGFRWMGPKNTSWLDSQWHQPGDAVLHCEILHTVAPQVLTSLKIQVNDYPVALTWKQKEHTVRVEGRVPATILQQRGGSVRVSLHVAQTLRFCDLHANNNDTRRLGLAVSLIGLRPYCGNFLEAKCRDMLRGMPKIKGWAHSLLRKGRNRLMGRYNA